MVTRQSAKTVAIGIDLGTCNSCIAAWVDDHVEIIPNGEGKNLTPSYVAFTKNEHLVGESAKDLVRIDPSNVVFDAKRLIGRKYSDPVIQSDIKYWPFKVISGSNDKPMIEVIHKRKARQLSAEEISSMVLIKIKEIAETFTGSKVMNAVITVPAYFNDAQKQATKDAGKIAGLNVVRIIVEPTAAAIAYGQQRLSRVSGERTVLVFDLGGGTFDVSIITISKNDYKVRAIDGDTHLGGEDFVKRMVDHFVEEFKRKHGKDLRDKPRSLRRLWEACEDAKIKLSFAEESGFGLDYIYDQIDFKGRITRARFEELNSDLFEKCINHVEDCLNDAKISKSLVHDVILVGGSTRIPKVRKLLQDFFDGKELCHGIHADEAVAHGAAIQAAILCGEGNDKVRDVKFSDVTPLSLGVEIDECEMSVVIPKNTPFPSVKENTYTTTYDNQESVMICVYQGERIRTEDNILLGKFRLSGIQPALKGIPNLIVTFSIDVDGILNVSAEDERTHQKNSITISNFRDGLSEHEIKKMIEQAEQFKAKDKAEQFKAKDKAEQFKAKDKAEQFKAKDKAEQFKADDKRLKERRQAKKSLEDYVNSIRKLNTELAPKLLFMERKKIDDAIKSTIQWSEQNRDANADIVEKEKARLQSICDPIIAKAQTTGKSGPGPSNVKVKRRSFFLGCFGKTKH